MNAWAYADSQTALIFVGVAIAFAVMLFMGLRGTEPTAGKRRRKRTGRYL